MVVFLYSFVEFARQTYKKNQTNGECTISYIPCLRVAPSWSRPRLPVCCSVDTEAVEGDFSGATLKQGMWRFYRPIFLVQWIFRHKVSVLCMFLVHHQKNEKWQGRPLLLMDILHPPCAACCTTRVSGAHRKLVVHNIVLYRWGGAHCSSHKPRQTDCYQTYNLPCLAVDNQPTKLETPFL